MMKPFSAVDGPRAEIAAALPTVPPAGNRDSASAADIAASLAALRAAAATDAAARAVLTMAESSPPPDELARLAAAAGDGGLFGCAARLDSAGESGAAIGILGLLAGLPGGAAAGQLGLAVIALRAGTFDLAGDLIAAHVESADRHPRLCSIAGIVELSRGNRAGAQAWLANASRVARRQPEFRAELQLAQRALLLMHLG